MTKFNFRNLYLFVVWVPDYVNFLDSCCRASRNVLETDPTLGRGPKCLKAIPPVKLTAQKAPWEASKILEA